MAVVNIWKMTDRFAVFCLAAYFYMCIYAAPLKSVSHSLGHGGDKHTQTGSERDVTVSVSVQPSPYSDTHTHTKYVVGAGTHLSVSPYVAPAVGEQLGHVVVAGELPQAGFQVQVPVETQRAVPPQGAAELIGRRISHTLGVTGGGGDEAVTCADLLVVEQVGAAVVSDPGPVRAESQFKVHEGPSGDHRQHACQIKSRQRDSDGVGPALPLREIIISTT